MYQRLSLKEPSESSNVYFIGMTGEVPFKIVPWKVGKKTKTACKVIGEAGMADVSDVGQRRSWRCWRERERCECGDVENV